MSRAETDDHFAAAARAMRSEEGVEQTLSRAVTLAAELVQGCEEAGVCLVRRGGRIETPAATSAAVQRADELQHELGEGPCLDAIWEQTTTCSPDLVNDSRWPTWGRRVAEELDVRAMLCFQLFTDDRNLGAMNLYSSRVGGFSDDDREEGLGLAAHVAVALGAAQQVESLNAAVVGRTVIGQAEGILMERFGLSAEQAFAVLRRVSQHTNVKLSDVASDLVRTRRTPG